MKIELDKKEWEVLLEYLELSLSLDSHEYKNIFSIEEKIKKIYNSEL